MHVLLSDAIRRRHLAVVSHKVVDKVARRERGVRPLMPRTGR